MKKHTRNQFIILALILAGVLLGMTSLFRPQLVPASAPATEFSASGHDADAQFRLRHGGGQNLDPGLNGAHLPT